MYNQKEHESVIGAVFGDDKYVEKYVPSKIQTLAHNSYPYKYWKVYC